MNIPRWAAPIAAIAVLAGASLALAGPASAAEHSAEITHARVLLNGAPVDPSTPIQVGQELRFEADWRVSGRADPGDTFSVGLPTSVRLTSSAPFFLTQNGSRLARCVYDSATAPGAIVCTFLPGGPYADPHGDVWFSASLLVPGAGEPAPTWTVSGSPVALPVPSPTPPGSWTPPFGTLKSGTGEIVEGRARLSWDVFLWPGSGPRSDQVVKRFDVADQLDSTSPNQPHRLVPGSFTLARWQQDPNDPSRAVPGSFVALPLDGSYGPADSNYRGEQFSAPVVDPSGKSYTFWIDGLAIGYEYDLSYKSEAVGAVSFEKDVFANTATVNGAPHPASASPRTYGGGSADAAAYASFTVSKRLTNNAKVTVPDAFELDVRSGTATETMRVPADGTPVNSGYYPAGTPIVLCEKVPVVAGVTWQKYTITGDGVRGPDADGCYSLTGVGGERSTIALTNVADAATVTPPPTATPVPTATPSAVAATATPAATAPAARLALTGIDAGTTWALLAAVLALTTLGTALLVHGRRRASAG